MKENRDLNMPHAVFNKDDFAELIGQPMKPGTILIGNPPSERNPSLPVIVFIQGLRNDSALWYKDNNMYAMSAAQFETVFLELYDTAGDPKSNWENGELLASLLEQISSYFDGRKLFLVGYSKGAVDAQTALVHFGKHHLAEGVISIAAPHYGSELADLANSRPAGWLANLIGANNEGTKSLQTGVMNHFRAITDELTEVGHNKYYTIAGDKAGPLLSLYSIGGLFIPGPSDGVVSVSSSRLPYAEELSVGDWNHSEIRLGTNVFPVFKETLKTPFPYEEKHNDFEEVTEELAILARGGKQAGTAAETFFVENGVERIVLNWVCSRKVERIMLKSPRSRAKKVYNVDPVRDDAYFFGAWHHCIELNAPEKGEWSISVFTEEESAYLFLAKFDSVQNNLYKLSDARDKKGWQIAVPEAAFYRISARNFNVTYEVDFQPSVYGKGLSKKRRATIEHLNFFISSKPGEAEDLTITLPDKGEGTYNTTINIEGFTPSGEKIQRTAIKTVYVDNEGKAY